MNTIKQTLQARTNIGTFNGLASNNYINIGTIIFNTNRNVTTQIEISATPSATATGNKQVLVFAQQSLDGVNFESGPVSGTDVTDEMNLTPIGLLNVSVSGRLQRRILDLSAAFITMPYSANIIIKNDLGTTLTFGSAEYSEVLTTIE